MKTTAIAVVMLLSACGSAGGNGGPEQQPHPVALPGLPEPAYGPEQRLTGTYGTGFEHSDFDGCWLTFTDQGAADFQRNVPQDKPGVPVHIRRYQLDMIGRRTVPQPGTPQFYGHLGASTCQVEAIRILAVRPLASE